MTARRHRWIYLRETLLALAVVALTFLNFGHISVSASGDVRVTPDSWCGSPMAPDDVAHAPCHACRADGVSLPPPPVEATPVCFTVTIVAYAEAIVGPALPVAQRPVQARGPPAFV
jgi:hypothetical protein